MKIFLDARLLLASWTVCLAVGGCTLAQSDVDGWLELGLARAAAKEWGAAIQAYDRAIELEPDHVKAHHNLANVYFRKGDFEPAAANYGRALELDPDYMLAAFHLGWTLRQLHRAGPAQETFERCLKIQADTPRKQRTRVDCIFGLGSIRHRAGDYVSSAAMMEQVLQFHPSHYEARYYLGMAYRQLGRRDEALAQLEIHGKMLSRRHEAMEALEPPMDP